MVTFLVRRLWAGAITLLAIATLAFLVVRLSPGSPFTSEKNVSPEVRLNIERKYGLDKPLWRQYLTMMSLYLQGDLGPSYEKPGRDVAEFVWPGFAVSVRLGAVSFVIALGMGLALGIIAAARQNRWQDHSAMSAATLGISIPNFLLGPILVIIFSTWLAWLLPTGWPENWTSWSELNKLILPSITLAMTPVAYVARLTRAGMLDVMNRDYIRTARAKGLSERSVFLKHGLKNGITPALTYTGLMAAYLVTGSIVVEKIFAIPGLGTHFVNSALARDYGIIMGTVLVYSTLVILFNLIVDVGYAWLDPRVRVS